MSKFLPTNGFKWIDPKYLDSNKYNKNSSKGCVLEIDFEYPKKSHELHNDYPLAPDKTEMLSKYQLMLAMLKNWYLTFLIMKNVWFIMTVDE